MVLVKQAFRTISVLTYERASVWVIFLYIITLRFADPTDCKLVLPPLKPGEHTPCHVVLDNSVPEWR